jgi:hypothetical protein
MSYMQNNNLALRARGVLVELLDHMNKFSKEVYKGDWYASDVLIQDWEGFYTEDCSPNSVPTAFSLKMVNIDGDYKNVTIYYYIRKDGSHWFNIAKKYKVYFQDKDTKAIFKLGWEIIGDLINLQKYSPMNFCLRFPTVTRKLTMEHLKGFEPVRDDIVLINFGGTDDFVVEADKVVDERIESNRRALGILTE